MVASELTLSSDESQTLFPDSSLTPRIALGMIVKDEETTLRKTLDSAIDAVEAIFIFDTGSTDGTLDLIREYRKEIAPKPIYLMQGEFVNFSVSRNKLLDFIENHQSSHFIDFILLLDANDEFHGVKELKEYASQRLASPDDDEGGFYILQKWLYGDVIEKYYNIFLIRPRKEWRYSGVVHEYIHPKDIKLAKKPNRCPDTVYIYQDRNENCEQSFIRYNRDKKLLLGELERVPDDPRTLFYLAQTCDCLELYDEAYDYYKRREAIRENGAMPEETYHSLYRLGNLCIRLKKSHEETVKSYTDALEFWNRVEPMLRLCEYYLFVRQQPLIAHGYATMALFAPPPAEALLFVSDTDYNYRRYNRFVVTAFAVGDLDRAAEVCQKMIDAKIATEQDVENMKIIVDAINGKLGQHLKTEESPTDSSTPEDDKKMPRDNKKSPQNENKNKKTQSTQDKPYRKRDTLQSKE